MLATILMLASQAAPEVTPSLTSLTVTTGTQGTCLTHPLQPATIQVNWTATNFNSNTHDFNIYRDGVLITTTDSLVYALQISGLVENDTHNPQSITFNYRIDIIRTSDQVVLATRSVSATKNYGTCA